MDSPRHRQKHGLSGEKVEGCGPNIHQLLNIVSLALKDFSIIRKRVKSNGVEKSNTCFIGAV